MAIFVVFQEDIYHHPLSAFNLVHETKLGSHDQYFYHVKNLEGKFFRIISEKLNHCISVSTKGHVYARSENEHGKLGIGNKQKMDRFSQVLTLKNAKIYDASAIAFLCLFVNNDREMYSYGYKFFLVKIW